MSLEARNRVLVVSDNSRGGNYLSSLLQSKGLVVQSCNFPEIFRTVSDFRPNLIFWAFFENLPDNIRDVILKTKQIYDEGDEPLNYLVDPTRSNGPEFPVDALDGGPLHVDLSLKTVEKLLQSKS